MVDSTVVALASCSRVLYSTTLTMAFSFILWMRTRWLKRHWPDERMHRFTSVTSLSKLLPLGSHVRRSIVSLTLTWPLEDVWRDLCSSALAAVQGNITHKVMQLKMCYDSMSKDSMYCFCTKSGLLILMKILKIVATICQILKLNAPKSRPRWGDYSTPQTPSWI